LLARFRVVKSMSEYEIEAHDIRDYRRTSSNDQS
jgi:hypothetical protein